MSSGMYGVTAFRPIRAHPALSLPKGRLPSCRHRGMRRMPRGCSRPCSTGVRPRVLPSRAPRGRSDACGAWSRSRTLPLGGRSTHEGASLVVEQRLHSIRATFGMIGPADACGRTVRGSSDHGRRVGCGVGAEAYAQRRLSSDAHRRPGAQLGGRGAQCVRRAAGPSACKRIVYRSAEDS